MNIKFTLALSISCTALVAPGAAQFSNALAGGPSTVNVGNIQTFTATLPTVDSGYYVQFYLRVASSNPLSRRPYVQHRG